MDYRDRQIQRNILIAVVSIIVLLLIIAHQTQPHKYAVGEIVENFSLPSTDDEIISLYEFKNTFFLIEFFHTEKITTAEPPEKLKKKGKFNGFEPLKKVNRAQNAFTNTQMLDLMIKPEAEIVFLSINVGQDADTVKDFVEICKKKWYVLLDKDKKIYHKFFDEELPGYIILDKKKKLVYRIGGWSGLVVSVIYNMLKSFGIPVKASAS